jgi:hypothetical protein
MTIEEFNGLGEDRKKELLVDAKKIAEYEDEIAKHELFQLDHFFIEVSFSVTHKFRKLVRTYTLEEVPLQFAAKVLAATT